MNGGDGRERLAVELAVIALVVTAAVVAVMYAVASPGFDHSVADRAESARSNFVVFSAVLSVLGTAAAWVVWLRWRRRAGVDTQPDGPARLLALGVATLPPDRHEWGDALIAEPRHRGPGRTLAVRRQRRVYNVRLACGMGTPRRGMGRLRHRRDRCYGVRRRGYTPPRRRCRAGRRRAGLRRGHMVVLLAACLVLLVAAPVALTTSRLARRVGVSLGVATGVVLLVMSRSGALDAGALTIIGPAQLLAFVVAPAVVAAICRSLTAAVQCIVWSFVFSAITMFPVYIIESIGRYRDHGELFLDADAPATSTLGDNLTDAVSWLVLIGPGLLIPLGVLVATAVATITRTLAPTDRSGLSSRR